jgi:hypothetical protein
MPEISRFYEIIIAMFFEDHNPRRFHARDGKDGAVIEIRTLRVLEGQIPPPSAGPCGRMGFSASRRIAQKLGVCSPD